MLNTRCYGVVWNFDPWNECRKGLIHNAAEWCLYVYMQFVSLCNLHNALPLHDFAKVRVQFRSEICKLRICYFEIMHTEKSHTTYPTVKAR